MCGIQWHKCYNTGVDQQKRESSGYIYKETGKTCEVLSFWKLYILNKLHIY